MSVVHDLNIKKELCTYFDRIDVESQRIAFKEKGYVVFRGVLHDSVCKKIYDGMRFVPTNKRSQWFRSHSKDTEISDLIMSELRGFIEKIVGYTLWNSYSFGMQYSKKASNTMEGHFDTSENPVSLTFCIHSSEIHAKNPICIDKATFSNPLSKRITISDISDIDNTNVERIDLKVGDICVFRGREHLHWRENTDSNTYAAVLCHYLDFSISDEEGNLIRPAKKNCRSIPRISKRRLRVKNYKDFKNKFSLFLKS